MDNLLTLPEHLLIHEIGVKTHQLLMLIGDMHGHSDAESIKHKQTMKLTVKNSNHARNCRLIGLLLLSPFYIAITQPLSYMSNSNSLITEIAGLHKIKKLAIAISWIELMLLIFLDYTVLRNDGIDIDSEFLLSINAFINHIFTGDFILALFMLVVIFIIYNFLLPFLFPLFIFKAFEIFYLITEIVWFSIGGIFRLIVNLFSWTWRPIKFVTIYDTEKFCAMIGYIKLDSNNIISQGRKWNTFTQFATDMHADNEIYEFFIRITSFFLVFSLALFFFKVGIHYQFISLALTFISLLISFQLYKLFMALDDIDNIIRRAIP